MTTLVLTLLLATAAGLLLRWTAGRFRPDSADHRPGLPAPGERATLVQVSAEHCTVCPQVARVLAAVAAETPGVAHVELRAEEHLDLLARYDVRRSPTVFVLDRSGQVRSRTSGAVQADQVRAALTGLLGSTATERQHDDPEDRDADAA